MAARISALFFAWVLVFGLSACGGPGNGAAPSGPSQSASIPENTSTQKPPEAPASEDFAREREPSDRRQLLIRATEEGRNQSRLRQEKRRRESQELMKALDSAEQERLLELLTKLLDSWEDRDPHNHPHHRPSPLEGGGEG